MLTAFLNSLLITRITFLILFYPSSFICFILWISILYLRSCWGLKIFCFFFITCDSRSKICRRVQLRHHFPNVTIHFTDSRSTPSYFSELLYDRIISINFSVILSLQVQRFATWLLLDLSPLLFSWSIGLPITCSKVQSPWIPSGVFRFMMVKTFSWWLAVATSIGSHLLHVLPIKIASLHLKYHFSYLSYFLRWFFLVIVFLYHPYS